MRVQKKYLSLDMVVPFHQLNELHEEGSPWSGKSVLEHFVLPAFRSMLLGTKTREPLPILVIELGSLQPLSSWLNNLFGTLGSVLGPRLALLVEIAPTERQSVASRARFYFEKGAGLTTLDDRESALVWLRGLVLASPTLTTPATYAGLLHAYPTHILWGWFYPDGDDSNPIPIYDTNYTPNEEGEQP